MKLLLSRSICLLFLVSLVCGDGNNGRGGSDNRKTNNGREPENRKRNNSRGPVRAQRCRKNKNKMKCAFPIADLGLEDRNVDEIELDLKGDGKTIVCERKDYSANGLSWCVG